MHFHCSGARICDNIYTCDIPSALRFRCEQVGPSTIGAFACYDVEERFLRTDFVVVKLLPYLMLRMNFYVNTQIQP
jgi:hypothetical protein